MLTTTGNCSTTPKSGDSVKLLQVLKDSKPSQSSFMYPNASRDTDIKWSAITPLRDQNLENPTETPHSANDTPTCKRSTPRYTRSGSTKSLGMRRRLRSVENSCSPFSPQLGMKRTPQLPFTNVITPAKKSKVEENGLLAKDRKYDGIISTTPDRYAPRNSTSYNRTCDSDESLIQPPSSIVHRKAISSFVSPLVDREEKPTIANISMCEDVARETSGVRFQTAGRKAIHVSKEAMRKAENLFSKQNDEYSDSAGYQEKKISDDSDTKSGGREGETKTTLSDIPDQVDSSSCDGNEAVVHAETPSVITVSPKEKSLSSTVIIDQKTMLYSDLGEDDTLLKEDFPDEKLLGVSENGQNRVSPCTSPVLNSKRTVRKRGKKNRVIQEKSAAKQTPKIDCLFPPKEDHKDSSMLSDDFELEMLAIDLTEKFTEACGANSPQKYPTNPDECTECKTNAKAKSSSTNNEEINDVHGTSSKDPSTLTKTSTQSQSITTTSKTNDQDDSSGAPETVMKIIRETESNQFSNTNCNAVNQTPFPTTREPQDDEDMNLDDDILMSVGDALDSTEKDEIEAKDLSKEIDIGFITASQKPIKISRAALDKAEKMICNFNQDSLPANPSLTNGDELSFVGFKTASNKDVIISEAALIRANIMLEKEHLNDAVPLPESSDPHSCVYDEPFLNEKTGNNGAPLVTADKLANLFKSGIPHAGQKRNGQFRTPRKVNLTGKKVGPAAEAEKGLEVCSTDATVAHAGHSGAEEYFNPLIDGSDMNVKTTCKKLLGVRNHGESQIIVSDESLVKAAEILEDLFC